MPFSLCWTWESASTMYRNEIDHIVAAKRFCLEDIAIVAKHKRQCGAVRAAGNHEFTSELKKLRSNVAKEDFERRRAIV
ncbi:hypothetical protein RB195_023176 [Necator americanus]|uniref:Uncharacterized protein n=1 Tax=Necator americanus TaxID=51031 RepID=A0ABR1EI56_NECAM